MERNTSRDRITGIERIAELNGPHPASLMMGYGYRPEWSEGALKPPIFQTSTFVFSSATEGKRFFELAHGAEPEPGERPGLIYSRLNNPGIEIVEDRLCVWERADRALTFASGMAAIATTFLAHLRPGDTVLHTSPVYGGTDHVIRRLLPEFGIEPIEIPPTATEEQVVGLAEDRRTGMIYVETPANPTNRLFDIALARRVSDRLDDGTRRPVVVVDNTFLGPVFQRPLDHGADLSVYSATKYLGGHSDLIAGAVVGTAEAIEPIAGMRTFLGTMLDPWTAWLLMRSLETLDLRMHRAADNARRVAEMLAEHPKVENVHYLGLLGPGDAQYDLYRRQCLGPGSVIAVELDGGEDEAFRFLDHLRLIHLAVSLGGTESLAEHPATMTHAGVDPAVREADGVTAGLVRLAIGVEHIDDLVADLEKALAEV